MGLKKGATNNPHGRPKGSSNKLNNDIREIFHSLITENISLMKKDLSKLQPKERISTLIKMTEFILPKLRSVESERSLTDQEYHDYLVYKKRQEKITSMSEEELQEKLRLLRDKQV